MKLAVIPARGGSKRIPRKNIKPFAGKPMIAWSIAAAQESGCFDRIVVSTDDDEIADVALAYGAEVPFKRPSELSDDYATTIPVVGHAVSWYWERGEKPAAVCCIYATAPFISPEDIARGLEELRARAARFAVSVTQYPAPIQRALRIGAKGRLAMIWPENFNVRSQDLERVFHDAGQFYWGDSTAWTEESTLFGTGTVPVILPSHKVQDIDTVDDWVRAEVMAAVLRTR